VTILPIRFHLVLVSLFLLLRATRVWWFSSWGNSSRILVYREAFRHKCRIKNWLCDRHLGLLGHTEYTWTLIALRFLIFVVALLPVPESSSEHPSLIVMFVFFTAALVWYVSSLTSYITGPGWRKLTFVPCYRELLWNFWFLLQFPDLYAGSWWRNQLFNLVLDLRDLILLRGTIFTLHLPIRAVFNTCSGWYWGATLFP
jgi:hypothetical protein